MQRDELQRTCEPGDRHEDVFRSLLELRIHKLSVRNPDFAAFARKYLSSTVVDQLAVMISRKLEMSEGDGEDHNIMVASYPVCYDLFAVAKTPQEAAGVLNAKYGGLELLLHNLCTRHPAFTVQQCSVLCLLAFGKRDQRGWVEVAIHSLSPEWARANVMPVELLGK